MVEGSLCFGQFLSRRRWVLGQERGGRNRRDARDREKAREWET